MTEREAKPRFSVCVKAQSSRKRGECVQAGAWGGGLEEDIYVEVRVK